MILHVDMDAFYAAVEERENPELRGKPVIVGGSATGRGVVSTANYEARKFGVHSAMPTAKAMRLCPHAVLVRTRMGFYASVSKQIRIIFHRYTPEVEPLSLDEAFLDVSGCEALFGSAESIGRRIKEEIRNELGLVASVGVAPNKFLAKLASDLEKPDGFTIIPAGQVESFLAPLPVRRLWGVGTITEQKLERVRMRTFGDIQRLSIVQARDLLGSNGEHFWKLAHGIDDRPVVTDRLAKTISHETTFPVDVEGIEWIRIWLLELTEQVSARMRALERVGRTVTIKVRYSDFDTITRSRSLSEATDSTDRIWQAASDLLMTELPDRRPIIRLIGVGVSNLEAKKGRQLLLFDEERDESQEHRLDESADQIRKRFGAAAIRRGSTFEKEGILKSQRNEKSGD